MSSLRGMARCWERKSERSWLKLGLNSLGWAVAKERRKRLRVWRIVRREMPSRSLDEMVEMEEADEDEDEEDEVEETERERW